MITYFFLNKLKLEINVEPPPQLNQSEMKQKTHNPSYEEFIYLQLEREK